MIERNCSDYFVSKITIECLETNESHWMRDQNSMANGPTKSCNMVLCCRHRVWSRIVIQQQNTRSEKPRSLFRFRQGVTVLRSIDVVSTSKMSSNKTP
ncbi:hypothetical protein TNCV_426571 [Trichonephila clavipes]|nr:hypothetical protein TNCV_426571 [Trichonephila clavipes]